MLIVHQRVSMIQIAVAAVKRVPSAEAIVSQVEILDNAIDHEVRSGVVIIQLASYFARKVGFSDHFRGMLRIDVADDRLPCEFMGLVRGQIHGSYARDATIAQVKLNHLMVQIHFPAIGFDHIDEGVDDVIEVVCGVKRSVLITPEEEHPGIERELVRRQQKIRPLQSQ